MSGDYYMRTIKNKPDSIKNHEMMQSVSMVANRAASHENIDENGFITSNETRNNSNVKVTQEKWHEMYQKSWDESQEIWIGQVSWLGGESDSPARNYVPSAVKNIDTIFTKQGPRITITPSFITQVMIAMNGKSNSVYEIRERAITYRDDNAIAMRNRRGYQPVGRNIYCHKRGVNSRRAVKKWMREHMGETIIVETM